MSRIPYLSRRTLMIATLIAIGASGTAFADDNSMSRFSGDSYAYFNSQPTSVTTPATVAAWRRAHPNGFTERELQALSSSDLSAEVAQIDPGTFSVAAADPTWRQTHPNGLTERELQALSSSSLALWQAPRITVATADRSDLADVASTRTIASRLISLFHPQGSSQGGMQ